MTRTKTQPSLSATLRKLALPIAVVAITAGATNAFASLSLTNIALAVHGGGAATDLSNEGHSITPDGLYVVGFQGTNSMLYHTNGSAGFLYNVATTALHCDIIDSTPSSFCAYMGGAAYRTNLSNQQELIISGGQSGNNADWMTANGGSTWGAKRRDTQSTGAPTEPIANGVAGTSSDVFYLTWWDAISGNYKVYVGKCSGAWAPTPVWDVKNVPAKAAMYGISSTGRAAGYRADSGNYILDWNGSGTPTSVSFNGLDGTGAGIAYSVSADGNIVFGQSPTPTDATHNHGYKVVFSGPNPTNGTVIFGQSPVSGGRPGSWGYKAAVTSASPGTLQSISELPSFPETVGTAGSASLPYGCTADGKYAVGMSYRGQEKAVIWDTSDANPANWTVTDLTDLAIANGIPDLFAVGHLRRAFSVGVNGAGELVVTGWGYDNAGGAVRAFVMTVPKSYLAAATTVVHITGISLGVGTVTINFTSSNLADTTSSFTVQQVSTLVNGVNAGFADIGSAIITGSAGTFQANFAQSGSTEFYRIHHP